MGKKPIELIIIGGGARGTGYASFAEECPDRAKVVAVAEPLDFYRNRIGDRHNIPEHLRFKSWDEALKQPKFADALVICTQDDMHEAPAVAGAGLGYHILLEKPMAPTEAACRRIIAAVKAAGVMFSVCHVLRYTEQTRKIKELIAQNAIGELISIQRLEAVGYWHQAHSFVRGNWRNEKETSFMLLAKSCHDLDWISYVMGKKCEAVQSFGSLSHFNAAHRPPHAADRCVDCPEEIERNCPYSALKIYLRDRFEKGEILWPANVLTPVVTRENLMDALKNGPYGRCVYACDNDVVDNQVVNFRFEGAKSASFTMTAFDECIRRTTLFGTRGTITAVGEKLTVFDFLTETTREIPLGIDDDGSILTGHGGGDGGLMNAFVGALENNDPSLIVSGPDQTLESHLMVFAAEKSRKENKIVTIEH